MFGIWVGASVRLFRRNVVPGLVLACLCLVAMLFLGSLLYESAVEAREKSGVILAAGLTARKGDGYGYAPTFNEPLPSGTEFTLVEARSGWYQIQLNDGARCWVSETAVEFVWPIQESKSFSFPLLPFLTPSPN